MTLRLIAICTCLLVLAGCSALPRNRAVPDYLVAKATVAGLSEIRYVVGDPQDMQRLARDVAATWPRERQWLAAQGKATQNLPPSHLLAVSGGGDNGAFGAGLLNGWSTTGQRPEFLLVTGISTGALIAPFAFLGPRYDPMLKDFYTNTRPEDIIEIRSFLAALTDDAVADTSPLRRMLQRHVDRAMLDEIAVEYARGRELWISTTNLDARQRIVWNMTKLAASRHPRAVELFHDIMIASAAIPGAFPPVMIEVEVDGERYQEMHVDGGTMAQVFIYPPNLELAELSAEKGGTRERILYVVMNSRIAPEWAETERNTISIAGRAISSMIHAQGIGDLYRIYLTAQRDGVEFNLANIPADFEFVHKEEFDTAYMRALYDHGFSMAVVGYPWKNHPPGFADEFRLHPLDRQNPATTAARK